MKDDAFDDVRCPFNYKAELKRARRALNAKVGKYVSENTTESYRELAKEFHLSVGTLSRIARPYKGERKPGPRPRQQTPQIEKETKPLSQAKRSPDLP